MSHVQVVRAQQEAERVVEKRMTQRDTAIREYLDANIRKLVTSTPAAEQVG
jgi:hypothetical protein